MIRIVIQFISIINLSRFRVTMETHFLVCLGECFHKGGIKEEKIVDVERSQTNKNGEEQI